MRQNYRTRALNARDPRFAKIADKLGYGTREIVAEAPAAPLGDEALRAAREKYQEIVGKRAYHGWSADEINAKIAEASA